MAQASPPGISRRWDEEERPLVAVIQQGDVSYASPTKRALCISGQASLHQLASEKGHVSQEE